MAEKQIVDAIREELTQRDGCCLFINTVGKAWFGAFAGRDGQYIRLLGGRCYPIGLFVGSPDLVGWKPVVITPEMVGQTFARFVGIEVKTATGKERAAQIKFLRKLQADGAMAGPARTVGQAKQIVGDKHVEKEKREQLPSPDTPKPAPVARRRSKARERQS